MGEFLKKSSMQKLMINNGVAFGPAHGGTCNSGKTLFSISVCILHPPSVHPEVTSRAGEPDSQRLYLAQRLWEPQVETERLEWMDGQDGVVYLTASFGPPSGLISRIFVPPFADPVIVTLKVAFARLLTIVLNPPPFLGSLSLSLAKGIQTDLLMLPSLGKKLPAKGAFVDVRFIPGLSAEKIKRKTKKSNRIKPHYFLTGIKTRNQTPGIKSSDLGPFELAPTFLFVQPVDDVGNAERTVALDDDRHARNVFA